MKSSNKSVEEELVHFCDIDISEILEVVTILQILNHVQSSYN